MTDAPGLPPIYDSTSVEPAPHQIVASFPPNTFLENLAVAADGTLYVTSHEAGEILRVAPTGESSIFATIEGKATGIALTPDSGLLVTGWDNQGQSTILQVTEDGVAKTVATLPEAQFLNGITPLNSRQYVTADSYRGCIWRFDTTNSKVDLWLEHPLLARSTPENPFPAANGIKRFGDTLYVSNTEKMLLLKIPIGPEEQPGEPTVFVSPTNIDDFAFDGAGNLYAATHIYNSVLRITPDGTTTVIAGAEQGVIGSTAVAFSRGTDDATSIYVVTNGGMFMPPPGGVVPANVVRLQVGHPGHPFNLA